MVYFCPHHCWVRSDKRQTTTTQTAVTTALSVSQPPTAAFTSLYFIVVVGRSVGDDAFNLQELLVGVISTNDSEAETSRALRQLCANETTSKLSRILGEERSMAAVGWKQDMYSKYRYKIL